MKAGWKTTEFWMVAISIVVSGLIASGAWVEGDLAYRILSGAAAILGALGYAGLRSWVKSSDSKARAIEAAVNSQPTAYVNPPLPSTESRTS